MNGGRFFFIIIFFFSLTSLFASGNKEEVIDQPINNGEWVLCITSFDVSSLPASRRIIGEVIQRELVNSLNTVDHRNRIKVSPEYAWYEGYAWTISRGAAAKALESKRNERDMLLFKGEPDWRYRQSLKTLEADIEKLEEALKKAAALRPLVAEEPSFRFTEGNKGGAFPNPPAEHGEYQFCKNEKADAFLMGSVSEYHGRIYVSLRLYALYTGSYVYEDSVIFSSDDTTAVVNEISGRLVAAIAGGESAEIAVHTQNEDALILINNSFAGRGGVPRQEYSPGRVTVEVFSENHESAQAEVELKSGELTEITANLRPLNLIPVNISAPEETGVLVYRGAMYVGEAPLTLRLPADRREYIFAETPEGRTARAVFLVDEPVPSSDRSGAPGIFSKRSTLGSDNDLRLQTRVSPLPGQKRVSKVRQQYYLTWGITWITGMAAWIFYGSYNGKVNANNSQPGNQDMLDKTRQGYYLTMGSTILVGAAAIWDAVMIGRYLYAAEEGAAPVVKKRKAANGGK
ncbi:hypothetical protein FACS189450_01380 [Spirochaetia bacterium]|nr:hypothetical protein FACS189450_01380 [Spirochaetia bacterium]